MRLNGIDVRHATMASVRDVVGVVTQDPHLFHDTLRANLLYARPEATEADVLEALEQAQIGHLVGELPDGLDTVIGERGYRLSGGEKQRVALARLMLKAPDIVVLDEATAHLDSESEAAVQRALRETLSGPHVARHRPPALDGARGRRAPGHRRRAASSSGARTPACWPTTASTPSSTAPSSPTRKRSPPAPEGPARSSRADGLRSAPVKVESVLVAGEGWRHHDSAAYRTGTQSGGLPVHTEICERLGIEFPIFAFTHCRDVVAAVSNAGGIGVLGAIGFSPEELEIELTWLDEHVGDHPYGVDIVIPGKYEGMGEMDPVKLEAPAAGHGPRRAPDLRPEDPGRPRRARAPRTGPGAG